jgi:hypothetical protein
LERVAFEPDFVDDDDAFGDVVSVFVFRDRDRDFIRSSSEL